MARGLGGRYGLPWDGVLTWGQDVCGLNFLLVPKEEASELCHQLAQMRAEGDRDVRGQTSNKAIMWSMQTPLPGQVQSHCLCLC